MWTANWPGESRRRGAWLNEPGTEVVVNGLPIPPFVTSNADVASGKAPADHVTNSDVFGSAYLFDLVLRPMVENARTAEAPALITSIPNY